MFSFIFNVIWATACAIRDVALTILTGKLSKISAYHLWHNSHDANPFEVCRDYFIKTHLPTNVSVSCKWQIIADFLKVAIDSHTDSKRMDVKLNEYLRDLRNNEFKEN